MIALATLTVLLCTRAVLDAAEGGASLGEVIGSRGADGAGRLDAYVVLGPRDCEGALDFLRLLARPAAARRIRVREILVVGGATDLPVVRGRLHAARIPYAARLVERRARRALRTLGYRITPFVLVFDERGSVRFSSPAPATPDEYVALARLLPELGGGRDHASSP